MKKNKLIYILPEYNNNLDGHIFYLANFVESIGKDLDIFLIIEKSKEIKVNIQNIKGVYIQKFSNILLRSIELFLVVFFRRFFGYKKVYIHYSYIGAIFSSLVMRLTFGKTFYWNCGMMWLFKKDNHLLLKISLKIVNYLVTGVEALKKGYSTNYGISKDKILIMPNWIEIDRVNKTKKEIKIIKEKEKLGFDGNHKIILFIHRLAERKGIHYVSKIAKQFERDDNIKFLVIGDGPYKMTLLEEIKNNKFNNIKYIGKISNKDIYKYFLLSDIFLMPSEEEGFPRVLLESMSCNIPYIASNIGGVKEISPGFQQEYIYNVGDVNGFVKGIRKIPLKKFDFKEYISKFDREEVKKIFIDLIKK